MRWLAATAVLAALAFPAGAAGHASVTRMVPGAREEVRRAPEAIQLRFDQAVTVLPNAVRVYDARGRIVSSPALSYGDGRVVLAPLRQLAKGAYTVRWEVVSGDGHVISGVYTFGVRVPAPEPTQAQGASGPTTTEHIVRWLYFVGFSLVVGGLAFRLIVLRGPLPPALEQRYAVLAGIGVVAVLEVGIVAFLLRAEDALQLPFERFLYGDLSPIAAGTRFGLAFIAMTLGFALVAAFVFLAWLTDRRWLLWPALLLAAALASGLSLSGHSAADAGASGWSELADWVHLVSACLWVGGLVGLLAAGELRRTGFVRFARLAPVLIAVLLAAGIYLSVLRLPHVSDLWLTEYGRVLLVKIGLVCVALAWGGVHHVVVRPRLDRPAARRWLPRSIAGESAVAMSVLLAAAVLVDSKPPPAPQPGPVQATSPLREAGRVQRAPAPEIPVRARSPRASRAVSSAGGGTGQDRHSRSGSATSAGL
jgi:copper transport protein